MRAEYFLSLNASISFYMVLAHNNNFFLSNNFHFNKNAINKALKASTKFFIEQDQTYSAEILNLISFRLMFSIMIIYSFYSLNASKWMVDRQYNNK